MPRPVRFTLTARRGWFGNFRGKIQDDPEHGPALPAAMKGKLLGSGLTFTKRYPTLTVFSNGRSIPFAEYCRSEYGIVFDEKVPGLPIRYEGVYDATNDSLSGTWQLGPELIRPQGGGKVYAVNILPMTGRWNAQRELV